MQTQTLTTITLPTVNHTNNNHTAPPLPRSFVSFSPRPRLTRGVSEIWAALTPAQRAEVDAIGRCVNDILAENPLAARPDCGAITVWLCEQVGFVWNFTTGTWEWEAENA